MKFLLLLLSVVTLAPVAKAQDYPSFEYTSYGYFLFSQGVAFKDIANKLPYTRRTIDMPEFAIEAKYLLNNNSAFEFEVEFEHYGVGTAMEFDNQEEFGEYENELEKGGEITLHEVYYEKEYDNGVELRVGKAPLFISLSSVLTNPMSHVNVEASDFEYHMLPVEWTEPGVQVAKRWGLFKVRAGVVSGLDSEFFNSPTWVGNGYQRRFDSSLANSLAGVTSFEIGSVKDAYGFALAGYYGDTADNRYKTGKLNAQARLSILSALLNYRFGDFGIMGQYIVGNLENSDLVSSANNNNPSAIKAKKVDLGNEARLQTIQLAYFLNDDTSFFLQREHANTFEQVRGVDYQDPYYDREMDTVGFRYVWDRYCFVKGQYGKQTTRLTGSPQTDLLRLAFGFDLDALTD
jgi:hypothetical protein